MKEIIMKNFLATCLIVAAQTSLAESVIVIGDSISAEPTSWPSGLRDLGHVVRDFTQGGRAAQQYDIPHDLKPVNVKTILYALGTNDGIYIDRRDAWGKLLISSEFTMHFKTHMDELENKGFTTILIVPARYSRYAEGMDVVRNAMFSHCDNTGASCVDLEEIWDESATVNGDTIHPNATLTAAIVRKIDAVLP